MAVAVDGEAQKDPRGAQGGTDRTAACLAMVHLLSPASDADACAVNDPDDTGVRDADEHQSEHDVAEHLETPVMDNAWTVASAWSPEREGSAKWEWW
jgi:hypothetical protein